MGRIWDLNFLNRKNSSFSWICPWKFVHINLFFPPEKLCFFMVPVAPPCLISKQGLLSTFSAMAGGWGQPRWRRKMAMEGEWAFHENERKNLPP